MHSGLFQLLLILAAKWLLISSHTVLMNIFHCLDCSGSLQNPTHWLTLNYSSVQKIVAGRSSFWSPSGCMTIFWSFVLWNRASPSTKERVWLVMVNILLLGSDSAWLSLSHSQNCRTKVKLCYYRRSFGRSLLVSSIILGTIADLCYCQTLAGLLMWSALSDERTDLSLSISTGPRQRNRMLYSFIPILVYVLPKQVSKSHKRPWTY
jgi:hypothetical protein